jgi:pimeloyl-ACP methyl ester carboxylesterase
MLPVIRKGTSSPTLVLLHFFGGSAREWTETAAILSSQFECISMDLPGFGDAANIAGYTVDEMRRGIADTIYSLRLDSFVLVGHSMSGKLSLLLAAQKITGLRGLVLAAPSPPSPEPIPESDRQKMLVMRRNRADAGAFLDGITANPLTGVVRERAIEDFVHCSPAAWSAWLEHGSKEDCAGQIGVVDCPSLVVTGDVDPSLHASIQKQFTLPHLSRARLEIISQCGHLPTMEAPYRLSSLISDFAHHALQMV